MVEHSEVVGRRQGHVGRVRARGQDPRMSIAKNRVEMSQVSA